MAVFSLNLRAAPRQKMFENCIALLKFRANQLPENFKLNTVIKWQWEPEMLACPITLFGFLLIYDNLDM